MLWLRPPGRLRRSSRLAQYGGLTVVVLALFFVLTNVVRGFFDIDHGYASPARTGNALLDKYAKPYCKSKGFKAYKKNGKHGNYRKVYDMFLLSTELDWLEIRLHTLAAHVDYFVIVESTKTFTGLDKPLYLVENWDRFRQFESQIIHKIVADPGDVVGKRVWDHEDYMRNALFNAVFPELMHTEQAPKIGDALIVSDVDEIPKPDTILTLRNCDFPRRLTLRSQFYYYSFEFRHRGEQWAHPQATTFQGLQNTISPKDLRNGEGGHGWLPVWPLQRMWEKADLWDAAWHCSSCFRTIKEMQAKMNSFSHQGWNTAENRDPKNIVSRVMAGVDLFGRESETYERIVSNLDLPHYIRAHRNSFDYLVDRGTEGAGFRDWNEFKDVDL